MVNYGPCSWNADLKCCTNTVFLAHRNPLPHWDGLWQRGQNFSIPGASDNYVHFFFSSLLWGFGLGICILPVSGLRRRTAGAQKWQQMERMEACCPRLEVCGGLFIGQLRSTLHPSPPTLLTVSQGSLALRRLLGLAKGKHSLGSEDGWGVGLGAYLSPSRCCFRLAASLY